MYYYLRHVFGGAKNRLWTVGTTDVNGRGTVTTKPAEAFKKSILAFEREWYAEHKDYPSRAGLMFAVWQFDQRPSADEALSRAMTERPHRIYVNLSDTSWRLVPFVLPDEVEFEIPVLNLDVE